MSKTSSIALAAVFFASSAMVATLPANAKEFKVNCSSVEDCMKKGNKLAKRRKLSLAQVAYKNAIKLDSSNEAAWRKFEILTIRISEEGGC